MGARGFPVGDLLRGRLGHAMCGLAAAAQLRRARLLARREVIALATDERLDDAMHQQVGVAANRAREVRVGVVGQAEVAAVGGGVDRLLHRSQQHGVDLRRVGPPLHRLRDGLHLGRLGVVTQMQA